MSQKYLAESEPGAKCLCKLLKVLLGISGQNSPHCCVYDGNKNFHFLIACVPLPAFCCEDLVGT